MIHSVFAPRTWLPFTLVLLAACGGSGTRSGTSGGEADGRAYPIVLGRDAVAGTRFQVESEVTSRQQQVTSMGGRTVESVDATTVTRLRATYEVLEVTAQGKVAHARYVIDSLTTETADGVSPVLEHGQVVEVWPAEDRADARVTIEGSDAIAAVRDAIDPVIKLTYSTRSDDALFGSAGPRAVGESWTPDLRAIADDLAANAPFRLDPAAMTGAVRVADRRRVAGNDGLSIEVTITAERAELLGMPEGAVVREGRLELGLEGFFPDDPSLPKLADHHHMTLSIAMEVPSDSGPVDLQMTMSMNGRGSATPLP